MWRNGKRTGLKIRHQRGIIGSSPITATKMKKIEGHLHGEYWIDGECTETFDVTIPIIDEGIDAILNVTFCTDQDETPLKDSENL